jgi:hypothetical protein
MGRLGHESGRDEGTCPHIQIGQVNTRTFAPEVHSTALSISRIYLMSHQSSIQSSKSGKLRKCLTSRFLQRSILQAYTLSIVQGSNQVPAIKTLSSNYRLSTNKSLWCTFVSHNHDMVIDSKWKLNPLHSCGVGCRLASKWKPNLLCSGSVGHRLNSKWKLKPLDSCGV